MKKTEISDLSSKILNSSGFVTVESFRSGIVAFIIDVIDEQEKMDANPATTQRLNDVGVRLNSNENSLKDILADEKLMKVDEATSFVDRSVIGLLQGKKYIDKETYQKILREDEFKCKMIKQFQNLYDEKHHLDGLAGEGVRLILLLEKSNRKLKGERAFNCYYINGENEDLNKSVDVLFETHKKERFQLVIKSIFHYATIDFHPELNACIVLDAANDSKIIKHILDLSKNKNIQKIFFATGKSADENIQKDFISCSLFACHHAINISKFDDDIYLQIEKKSKAGKPISYIEWYQLPAILVTNTNSRTFLTEYVKRNPNEADFVKSETHNFEKDYSLKQTFKTFKKMFKKFLSENDAHKLYETLHEKEPSQLEQKMSSMP